MYWNKGNRMNNLPFHHCGTSCGQRTTRTRNIITRLNIRLPDIAPWSGKSKIYVIFRNQNLRTVLKYVLKLVFRSRFYNSCSLASIRWRVGALDDRLLVSVRLGGSKRRSFLRFLDTWCCRDGRFGHTWLVKLAIWRFSRPGIIRCGRRSR